MEPDKGAPWTVAQWQAELERRWQALGQAVLDLDPQDHPTQKLDELVEEYKLLVVVTQWYRCGGNITHAAERLDSSRRVVRRYVVAWRKAHPRAEPWPPAKPRNTVEPRRRRRKPKADTPVPETTSPESKRSDEPQ